MQLFSRRLVGTVLGCVTLLSACGGGAPDTTPTEGPASARRQINAIRGNRQDLTPSARHQPGGGIRAGCRIPPRVRCLHAPNRG